MPDEDSGSRPTGNANCDSAPVHQSPVSDDRASDTERKIDETKKLSQDVHWITHATFWSQVALGIIGIGALWIYHGQLDEMRKATEANTEALKLARDSSDISGGDFERTMRQTIHQTAAQLKSAEAAKNAADTATNALVKVQRAFCNPTVKYDYATDPSTGKLAYSTVSIQWVNDGVTPAIHFASFNGVNYTQPPVSVYRWPAGMIEKYNVTSMGPKGVVYSPTTATLSLEQLEMYSKNHFPIYLWGWARYNDVFSRTKRHLTRYCYRIYVVPMIANGKQTGFTENPENCEDGNCTDDDCKVQ